jgi:hypothetical protein
MSRLKLNRLFSPRAVNIIGTLENSDNHSFHDKVSPIGSGPKGMIIPINPGIVENIGLGTTISVAGYGGLLLKRLASTK